MAALVGSLSLLPGKAVADPRQAQGQAQDPSERILSRFTAEQRNVRDVIHDLFAQANVTYTIASDVQGTVTVDLSNVTFRVALENVLKQVEASYRVEGGVFRIQKLDDDPQGLPADEPTGKLALKFNDTDIREALQSLFNILKAGYTISPDVEGTVTGDFRAATFATSIQQILKQVDATYDVVGGVYEIHRAQRIQAGSDWRTIQMAKPETTITQDAKFLYILRGSTLYKVRKSDLKVVAKGTLPG
jgi:bla regulator protein BlaR1